MSHPVAERSRRVKSRICRTLKIAAGGCAALLTGLVAYLYFPRSVPPKPATFTLIAHRAVSQTLLKSSVLW